MKFNNNNSSIYYSSIIAIATSCTEECITFITKNYKDPQQKPYIDLCKDCVFKCIVLTDVCTSNSPSTIKALQECMLMSECAAYEFSIKQTENRHERNVDFATMFGQFAVECRKVLLLHTASYYEVLEEPPASILN